MTSKPSNKNFHSEREGQIKFFENLKISADIELTHNTDGIYKGTLFEFKLTIPDINKVLFQAIKYLSHKRIKGEPIPAQILLIALNEENAYLFNSSEFLSDIEKIYAGAASKNNSNFNTKVQSQKIDFSTIKGLQKIIEIIEIQKYTKINIDVFSVVGWANRYYSENPKASKSKLFEELRKPIKFKDYIYPWKGKDIDFKYINDLLNATILKKELGAFYTPKLYCLKAVELVRAAIKQLPSDNNYIILDRSAGTGNLEEFLTDKLVSDITIGELNKYISNELKDSYLKDKADIIKMYFHNRNFYDITVGELEKQKTKISLYNYLSDNEISHTIVNTYELKEWIVLSARLGNKAKLIIPPNVNPKEALVSGGDSLSENFILGSSLKKESISKEYLTIIDELNSYVSDKKTNIILLENPPYRDGSGEEGYRSSYVRSEMKKDKLGIIANDIANQFIWSGWKYYLKKPDDFYILFSPIKYWKSTNLCEKKFINGFLFNREHFHASPSAISCILWNNKNEKRENLILKAYDINTKGTIEQEDDELIYQKDVEIKKAYKALSEFTLNKWEDSDKPGIVGSRDGIELVGEEKIGKYNKNIIAYLRVNGFAIAPMNVNLTTIGYKIDIKKNVGFYLRINNYIEKLPLFAAKLYPQKNWYERDVYFTTADGGINYINDKNFLKTCFIFTCLSQRNHCRSFNGSDGRFYKNELCFDKNTIASNKLLEYKLTMEEKDLLDNFNDILSKAKLTKTYNSKYTYGTYQIDDELNTRYKNENDEWIYNYPELNTAINSLRTKLNKYYYNVIQSKLFEYELLK